LNFTQVMRDFPQRVAIDVENAVNPAANFSRRLAEFGCERAATLRIRLSAPGERPAPKDNPEMNGVRKRLCELA